MAHESEYEKLHPNTDLQKRKEYWEIAKGLQRTDGLTIALDNTEDTIYLKKRKY